MRLAFVSSLVPEEEPRSGFAIANRAVVDGLRALGHDVTAIGARQGEADRPLEGSRVLATANLENARASTSTKLGWAGRAFTRGLPFAAAKLDAITTAALDGALREARPDGLILNSYQMAAAFPALVERPYVYLSHNVEARTATENAAAADGLEAFMYRRDARLLARLEAKLVAGARHVWCLSEEDRRALGPDLERSGVLPLLLPAARSLPAAEARPFDAVLIGTWTWAANAAGLRWLVREVVPLLPRDMRIAVAGSVPEEIDLSDERIVVMGRVDSADGFLSQGHVVPLIARGGTGVQLKSIEAFQRGIATVATASSVRGIEAVPDNCTVADTPNDFAAALIEAARRGRAGEELTVDPSAWIERQRSGLAEALARGVAALA